MNCLIPSITVHYHQQLQIREIITLRQSWRKLAQHWLQWLWNWRINDSWLSQSFINIMSCVCVSTSWTKYCLLRINLYWNPFQVVFSVKATHLWHQPKDNTTVYFRSGKWRTGLHWTLGNRTWFFLALPGLNTVSCVPFYVSRDSLRVRFERLNLVSLHGFRDADKMQDHMDKWSCPQRAMRSYMRGDTAGHLGRRNKRSSVVCIPLCIWPLSGNMVFTTDGQRAPRCSLLTQVPSLSPCYPRLTHTSHTANWRGWELARAQQPWAHLRPAGEALIQLTWESAWSSANVGSGCAAQIMHSSLWLRITHNFWVPWRTPH